MKRGTYAWALWLLHDFIYVTWETWDPSLKCKLWFIYFVCHSADSELWFFFFLTHFFSCKSTIWGDANKISHKCVLHHFMIIKERLLWPGSLPNCCSHLNMLMGILFSQSVIQQFSTLSVFQVVHFFQSNKAIIFAKGIQPWWAKTLWYVRAKLFGWVLEVICGSGKC